MLVSTKGESFQVLSQEERFMVKPDTYLIDRSGAQWQFIALLTRAEAHAVLRRERHRPILALSSTALAKAFKAELL